MRGYECMGRAWVPCPPCLTTRPLCVSAPAAAGTGKKGAKSKEELVQEKKRELEKRLQDVSGQLNHNKKPPKKGTSTCVWGSRGRGGEDGGKGRTKAGAMQGEAQPGLGAEHKN